MASDDSYQVVEIGSPAGSSEVFRLKTGKAGMMSVEDVLVKGATHLLKGDGISEMDPDVILVRLGTIQA